MSKKLGAISVRLTEEQHQGLALLGAKVNTDSAQLVRWAVDGLLDYVKACGGTLHLPLDFTTGWSQLRKMIDADEAAHGGLHLTPNRLNEEPAKYPSRRTGTK